MADENFLQPEDDSSVAVNNPSEQMPGLAGFVKTKFEDSEMIVSIPSNKTDIIQECHLIIGHIICDKLESIISW